MQAVPRPAARVHGQDDGPVEEPERVAQRRTETQVPRVEVPAGAGFSGARPPELHLPARRESQDLREIRQPLRPSAPQEQDAQHRRSDPDLHEGSRS